MGNFSPLTLHISLDLSLPKGYLSDMGFYATEQLEAVLESHQENGHPPSKNRVWGFSTTSATRAGFFESQPVEPHREKWPTPTTTVSGVHYYGYRQYSPEIGRWLSRDPDEELGFMLYTGKAELELASLLAEVKRLLPKMGSNNGVLEVHFREVLTVFMSSFFRMTALRNLYNFIDNDPLCSTDLLGLQTNEPPPDSGQTCCDNKAQQKLLEDLISKLAGQLKGAGSKGQAINILIKIAKAAKDSKKKCDEMNSLVLALEEFSKSIDMSGCTVFCNQMYAGLGPTSSVGGVGYYACLAACAKAFP